MGAARLVLTFCLVAVLAGGASGCGGAGGASGSSSDQILTIYSSLPLQGGAHERSQEVVNGEKLALRETRGRVGQFKLGYVSMDDSDARTGSWDPGLASANARTAAQDRSTIAYLGDWDSGATAVSLPIVNGAGILQVSPASSYVGLTRGRFAGRGEPDRYYPAGRRTFGRIMPSDEIQAAAQVAYMRAAGVRRLYIVRGSDPFDAELAVIVAARAAAGGLRLVGEAGMSAVQADDARLAARPAAAGADAVFYGGAPTRRAALLLARSARASQALKLFCPYFVDQPDFLAALGSARRGAYVTTPALAPALYPPPGQRFVAAYRATFGAAPGPYAAYGYEAMRLVLGLVREARARGNDRQAVVSRLFAVRGRDSVLGRYSIGPTGDTTLSRYAGARVRGRRLHFDRLLTK